MSIPAAIFLEIPFFSGLSERQLESLAAAAVIRTYHSKMLIFLDGEPADWIYFLLEGYVKLYKAGENGQEKTVLIIKNGEIFGESGLFFPNNYAVTAETIDDCRALLIPAELLKMTAEQANTLLWRIAEVTNLRLRRAYRQARNQALMGTYSRLISRLYKLFRDYGEENEKGYRLKISLTHQDLANFIGASRETVSRLMKEMEREGLLTVDDHHLFIADPGLLQEELETI